MSVRVTLELPDEVAHRAQAFAARSQLPIEAVLAEWVSRAAEDPPVESLSDAEVLILADGMMTTEQQEELSGLLYKNQEGELQEHDRARFEELMSVYRRGLLRKAQALCVAVERGLRPRLS